MKVEVTTQPRDCSEGHCQSTAELSQTHPFSNFNSERQITPISAITPNQAVRM